MMIELRHLNVRHFVTKELSHLATEMLLYSVDVVSLSIMSGRNNMRYRYYRICFGICMQSL